MMAAAAPAERTRPSADQRRQSLAKLMQFARAEAEVATTDGTLPGPGGTIAYRLYAPALQEGEAAPGFVFFHGGGMVAGSIETHDRIAAALASATGCRLISIDYRLAPEHKFPAAVEDAIAATEYVARNAHLLGIDAERLVVGGDSAGATLAAVVCQHARQHAGLAIVGAMPDLSRARLRGDLALARGVCRTASDRPRDASRPISPTICPTDADPADPRISPLRALNLKGLPTAIIHTAEFDPMRDEGNAYARRLLASGVTVEHVCHDGMIHNFHAMSAVLAAGPACPVADR